MTSPTLESLFVQFCRRGDPGALATVFDRVAPELARVASYLAGGDAARAADLLQSTWLVAIDRAGTWDENRALLPWLLGILANHARNQQRDTARHRVGADAELLGTLLATDDPVRASQEGEFQRLLAAALVELAPPFREVVTLHVQHGLTAKEIGEALGRPAGTVRTQIVRGLDRLRTLLPAGLATAGLVGTTLMAQDLARTRQVVMAHVPKSAAVASTKAWKPALLAMAAVVVLVGGWLGFCDDEPTLPVESGEVAERVVAAAGDGEERTDARTAVDVVSAPEVARPQERKPRRRITVHVRRDEEPKVVAGELVALCGMAGDPRFAMTDVAGDAVFDDVVPSQIWWVYLSGVSSNTTVSAKRLPPPDSFRLEATLEVRGGKPLLVRVVDAAGKPVAGAEVFGNGMQSAQRRYLPVGRTDANGELHLRNQSLAQYRARASGHATSPFAEPKPMGAGNEVVLTMKPPIAPLQGRVLDVDGTPIAAELGTHEFTNAAMEPWYDRTAADGSFTFDWLAAGHVAFVARVVDAKGTRIAIVRADVPRSEPLEIKLQPAASVTVSTARADGSKAPGESVRARLMADGVFGLPFCEPVTRTGNDGRVTIGGLAPGRWQVQADFGQSPVKRTFDLTAGTDVAWDAVAPAMHELKVRVLNERREPLSGWRVSLLDVQGQPLPMQGLTTDTGELHPGTSVRLLPDQPFTIVVCEAYEDGGSFDFPTHRLPGQVVDGTCIDVVVPDRSRTTHSLRGRLLGPDGEPVVGSVKAVSQQYYWMGMAKPIGADGTFVLGPFPPGRYPIEVLREGMPAYRLSRVEIPFEGDRDLGDVVLASERTVRATPAERAAVPTDVRLQLVREDGNDSYDVDRDTTGTFVSDPVPPGRYLLRGSGRTHVVAAMPVTVGTTDVAVTFRCEQAPMLRLEIPLLDEERSQSGWSGTVTLRRGDEVVVRREVWVRFNGHVPTPFTVQIAAPAGSYMVEVRDSHKVVGRTQCELGPNGGTATLVR